MSEKENGSKRNALNLIVCQKHLLRKSTTDLERRRVCGSSFTRLTAYFSFSKDNNKNTSPILVIK
jgi:hypothetical protein